MKSDSRMRTHKVLNFLVMRIDIDVLIRKLKKRFEISVNIRNFKGRLKLVCLFELQVEINLIIRKSA